MDLVLKKRGGVQNSENLADVIYVWPLAATAGKVFLSKPYVSGSLPSRRC